MKIDTLIFAGASSKAIGYIGSLYAINNCKLINLKNIKNIIGCSSGAIFGFFLLLNFNTTMMYKLLQKIDIIDLKNFNSDELFINNGILNNNNIKKFLKTCIKNKYNLNDISFLELYKKTNINFIVKVYNLSLQKTEYFSYKNQQNMSVLDAIQISTCIPIIFKPIKYNGNYYIDGGIHNNIPFLKNKEYKNYLLIYIAPINKNLNNPIKNYDNIDFIDYIALIFNIVTTNHKKKNKRHIRLIININMTTFDIKSILDQIVLDSYNQTIKHIKNYKL